MVRPLAAAPPQGTMHAVVYAVASAATLESTWDAPSQQTLWWWWWRDSPEAATSPLPSLPEKLDGVPILSDDGSWLVTVERSEPPPASPLLVLRRLGQGHTQSVGLAELPSSRGLPSFPAH